MLNVLATDKRGRQFTQILRDWTGEFAQRQTLNLISVWKRCRETRDVLLTENNFSLEKVHIVTSIHTGAKAFSMSQSWAVYGAKRSNAIDIKTIEPPSMFLQGNRHAQTV